MLVTLYGPDSYRRLQKLQTLTDLFIEKRGSHGHERIKLDEDSDLEKASNFLASVSMFSPKKLLILDEPFENVKGKDLKALVKDHEESSDVTIILNTTKKYPATFKFLSEDPNKLEEFPKLQGAKLKAFITNKAKELGVSLESKEIDLIAESLGADTWRIVTELERLAFAKPRDKFSGKDFDAETAYFPALNTLKRGFTEKERLIALEKLISIRRDDPGRVFNGLAFKPGNEKEADMYASYDVAVKSGKLDYEEVLLSIALGLEFDPLAD